MQGVVDKIKSRIEKAKVPFGSAPKKKEKTDEPEAKKRREDMNEDEKLEFDSWLDEVKTKRNELVEKRSNRHFRKQQLSKRYSTKKIVKWKCSNCYRCIILTIDFQKENKFQFLSLFHKKTFVTPI